jgi:anti-anti-sigma factor
MINFTCRTNVHAKPIPSPSHTSGEMTEIVRGNEGRLLDRLTPQVRRQNLTLDLDGVERIDAAGIAALITLYRAAQESGHSFTVVNPSHHVAQILEIVGLTGIFAMPDAGEPALQPLELQETAA